MEAGKPSHKLVSIRAKMHVTKMQGSGKRIIPFLSPHLSLLLVLYMYLHVDIPIEF